MPSFISVQGQVDAGSTSSKHRLVERSTPPSERPVNRVIFLQLLDLLELSGLDLSQKIKLTRPIC